MSSLKDVKPQIYNLIQSGWYGHLLELCDGVMSKKGKDPTTMFWKAYALGMTNRIPECIRQLEAFQSRRDMQFPVNLALVYFHKKSRNIDHDTIDKLNSELSIAEDVTKETGLLLAARFALYSRDFDEAHRLSEKLLGNCGDNPSTPSEMDAVAIGHWATILEVRAENESNYRNEVSRLERFDRYMQDRFRDTSELDLLMAWAACRVMLGRKADAINVLNKVIAMNSAFAGGLTEKALLLASAGEWEQALDTAQRALDIDSSNLDALKVIAVHAYTHESQLDDAFTKLEDYSNVIREKEPNNAEQFFLCAQLFSRICCRQPAAIELCQSLLERAIELNGTNAKYFCELGNVLVLNGQFQSAIKMFRESSKKDSQSFSALEGMILCQLLDGLVDDAEAQIELLSVMAGSDDLLTPEYAYLQALLAQRKSRDMTLHLEKLQECKNLLFSRISHLSRNQYLRPLEELIISNPDFMLQLGVAYMTHLEAPLAGMSGSSSTSTGSQLVSSSNNKPSPAVESGMNVLQEALVLAPGMSAIYIEMARVHLALNKHDEAHRLLRQCLQLAPNNAAALVALAKVEISRRNTTQANRALEQALSGNFSVRSEPLFRLVQATVRAQEEKLEEATSELESIVQLPEFRQAGSSDGGHGRMATDSLRLADDDIVTAYVVLSSMLSKQGRQKEARKVLANAKVLFAGTSQEVQILIASSQLAVERNDYDSAIRMLDKITEDSPTFLRSRLIKAEIMLNNSHDKEGFTKCYQELVDHDPTSDTYSLLGEAYLRILNPEAAVGAFREAFRRDPRNISLRARIGKALVATHEYHQAIDFYESSLRDMDNQSSPVRRKQSAPGSPSKQFANAGESVPLAHDLAKLYIKLGRMESASRVLTRILHNEEANDTADMREDIQTLRLLSTVQTGNKQPFREVLDTLTKALSLEKEVVNSLRSNSITTSDLIDAEKQVLSDICVNIGRCYMSESGNEEEAEKYFKEALQHDPQNTKGMYDLASLRFRRGELDQCAVQCNKILLANPGDEDACVMLADILFRDENKDIDTCVEPLQKLLASFPNHYNALQKLILYLRRLGKLEQAPPFIQAAEKNDNRSGTHAGLHYCKGLYAKYTNDVVSAVNEFNLSRKDAKWGADSLMHMIEMYLNPDQENVWEDDKGDEEDHTETPLDNESTENIRVAEALLEELRPVATDQRRVQILENYALLATKQKSNIDKAMQSFIEMLEDDKDYLPAVLGMSTGFMIEKSQHKARNLLKRVAKMEMSQVDGEDFEKANLFLAKFYVDKSKYDLAQDLCKRCLAQNKSCSQAWEILALSMEKEMEYKNAAECYEKAWKLEFEASATVGFKLAFNYLKCSMHVEAIDICEKVLSQYPEYPRIREEILAKAQSSLRP